VEVVWVAPVLMIPITVIAWKHGINGDARSLIQGLLVVFAAMLASGAYLALKLRLDREPDFFEKFWIALPLLASSVVTGRCIFGRLVRVIARTRRRPQPQNEGQ
jgi:hypothetical protein